MDAEQIRSDLQQFEAGAGKTYPKQARVIPFLEYTDIGECYPHCDNETDF